MNAAAHPLCPTKHSMKRRAPWHDYRSPGTYMLTTSGEAFDACHRGQLLQVCPWDYHTENRDISRGQCLMLNEMAEAICSA